MRPLPLACIGLLIVFLLFISCKRHVSTEMEGAFNSSPGIADSLSPSDTAKTDSIKQKFETGQKGMENVLLKKNPFIQISRELLILLVLINIILVFTVIILIFFYRNQHLRQLKRLTDEKIRRESQESINRELELEKVRLETNLKGKKIQELEYEKQLREQELVSQSLIKTDLMRVNRSVQEKLLPFKFRFARKKDQEEFLKALSELSREAARDPLTDFEMMFSQLHTSFFEKLLRLCPALTKSELQVCAMIRLNLSSKDIARMVSLSVATIETSRHHIRKKLGLESKDSLTAFMITV